MPQMSNLWWLPLLIYTSTAMFMVKIIMFDSNLEKNNIKTFKSMKTNFKNWMW